jgi:RNA-dependent RNA polymerase
MDANELTLQVSNIPLDANAQHLASFFRQYGYVSFCKIETNEVNRSKGIALVTFSPPPENLEWSSLLRYEGRQLRIKPIQKDENSKGNVNVKLKEAFEAERLQLGIFKSENVYSWAWETTTNVSLIWDFPARKLNIIFLESEAEFSGGSAIYRFQCRFTDVKPPGLLEAHEDEDWGTNETVLTLNLRRPPKIFRYHGSLGTVDPFEWSEEDAWLRVIHIQAAQGCDLGYMLSYRIHFSVKPEDEQKKLKLHKMLCYIADYNFIKYPLSFSAFEVERYNYSHNVIQEHAADLDFDVLFKLQSLVSYGIFAHCNLDSDFFEQLKSVPPKTALTVFEMFYGEQQRIYNPTERLREAHRKLSRANSYISSNDSYVPSHCVLIRKLIITPTKTYTVGPIFEVSNRVLRHYKSVSNDFLRVAFTDESLSKMINNPDSYTMIYDRIRNTLLRGIQIGSRTYEFLAFSASQLRDHSCWFIARDSQVKAEEIREWMGNFSSIKTVAKYAARMGQCFSSTRPVGVVKVQDMINIPDIARNGYTFSDGVGKISHTLAEKIACNLELDFIPSSFQFRLGGLKGVLAVDSGLEGESIAVRPSQKKFDSKHRELEIIRTSMYAPCYLNRQVITLLSALGVRDEVFHRLKDKMISRLNSMLQRPESAVSYLRANSDSYGVTQAMVDKIEAGLLDIQEPYLVHCIKQFQASQLKELKLRTRIYVPKGSNLMGVIDESWTLAPDEVFVQYRNPERLGRCEIMKGPVVVTRNPAFHPGDVRVLHAKDIPELHHLVDVIVFSAKGKRDIPSMLSGGDLDGDLYVVYQERDLIPELQNFSPMDYSAPKPQEVSRVHIDDVKTFFTDYIINDNLGVIAHAHLALADSKPDGVFSQECLRLAVLHSAAVDFPKTGIPAKIDRSLRVKQFPDFMEKKDRPSYKSPHVLGQIYRGIHYSQSSFPVRKLYPHPFFRYPGFENYISDAIKAKQMYDIEIATLMNYHGVHTEVEAVTGYILKLYNNRRKEFDIRQTMLEQVRSIRKAYRDIFLSEFQRKVAFERHRLKNELDSFRESGATGDEIDLKRKEHEGKLLSIINDAERQKLAKASSWYFVTYHPHFFTSHTSERMEERIRRSTCTTPESTDNGKWHVSQNVMLLTVFCQMYRGFRFGYRYK